MAGDSCPYQWTDTNVSTKKVSTIHSVLVFFFLFQIPQRRMPNCHLCCSQLSVPCFITLLFCGVLQNCEFVTDMRTVRKKRERFNQIRTNEFICPHQQKSMTEVEDGCFLCARERAPNWVRVNMACCYHIIIISARLGSSLTHQLLAQLFPASLMVKKDWSTSTHRKTHYTLSSTANATILTTEKSSSTYSALWYVRAHCWVGNFPARLY